MTTGFISGDGGVQTLSPVTFGQTFNANQVSAVVLIDGLPYPFKSAQIDKNAHGATNTAKFTVSVKDNPDWTKQLFRGNAPLVPGSVFSVDTSNTPVYVQIKAGFTANPQPNPSPQDLDLRFYGIVDQYQVKDLDTTEFSCRSLAAPLTTDAISTSIQNMTTVDFIKKICAPYNLTVVIDPSLTNPFSLAKVYAQDFVTGLRNLKKWDVLQRSSLFDDVDVWEDDGTIYYVHPWNVQKTVPNLAKSLKLQYGQDIKSFTGIHAPQFSKNVVVRVHSYTPRVRQSVNTVVASIVNGATVTTSSRTAISTPVFGTNNGTRTTYSSNGSVSTSAWTSSGGPASGNTTAIAESGKEVYDIPLPNLNPTECQAWAMSIWRQISMHEYQGQFDMAMTPALLPFCNIESRLFLSGYPMSAFNSEYWPRTMSETITMSDDGSAPGGWMVSFHCVNHTLPLGGGV